MTSHAQRERQFALIIMSWLLIFTGALVVLYIGTTVYDQSAGIIMISVSGAVLLFEFCFCCRWTARPDNTSQYDSLA